MTKTGHDTCVKLYTVFGSRSYVVLYLITNSMHRN